MTTRSSKTNGATPRPPRALAVASPDAAPSPASPGDEVAAPVHDAGAGDLPGVHRHPLAEAAAVALATPEAPAGGLPVGPAESTPSVRATVATPGTRSATVRRIRQVCKLSEAEYAALTALKKRPRAAARPMKRGALLRAGLQVLARMDDATLFRALDDAG